MIALFAALLVVQAATAATGTVAATTQAAAASPAPQRNMTEIPPEAARLIDNVMSPFCPGLILTNCPTIQADSLRKVIRARISAGESREQVLAGLQAVYGDAIRSAPDRSGFGLTAWVVPAVGVVTAVLLLFVFLKRSRREPVSAVAPPPVASSADAASDAALRERLAERLRHG